MNLFAVSGSECSQHWFLDTQANKSHLNLSERADYTDDEDLFIITALFFHNDNMLIFMEVLKNSCLIITRQAMRSGPCEAELWLTHEYFRDMFSLSWNFLFVSLNVLLKPYLWSGDLNLIPLCAIIRKLWYEEFASYNFWSCPVWI